MGLVLVLLAIYWVFSLELWLTSPIVSSGPYTIFETRSFSGPMKEFFRTCSYYLTNHASFFLEYWCGKGENNACTFFSFFNLIFYIHYSNIAKSPSSLQLITVFLVQLGLLMALPLILHNVQKSMERSGSPESSERYYSMNLQLVCDDNGRITYYIAGRIR